MRGYEPQPHRWAPERQSFHTVLRVLLRRRWWLIGAILACVALATVFNLVKTPIYEATATIELNRDNGVGNFGLEDMMGQNVGSIGPALETDLKTETSILKGDSLAIDVIHQLKLASQPPFLAKHRKGDKPLPAWEGDPAQRGRLIGIFEKRLLVSPVVGTRLIQATFRSEDPAQAAEIANALIQSYKVQYLQSRYDATSEASQWLGNQLNNLKSNVEDSEKRLTEFENASGMLSLQGDGSTADERNPGGGVVVSSPVMLKLEMLNSELTAAETNRIEKEAIYRLAKSGDTESLLALANNPPGQVSSGEVSAAMPGPSGGLGTLQYLQQKKLELKDELAQALNTYGPNNRHLKDLELQFNTVEGQISQELQNLVKRAQIDLQLAQQTEDQIRQEFEQQQKEVSKLNEKTVQLALLSQEANSSRKLYEDLYTRLQEADVSAGVKATNITMVDPARPEAVPVSPRWTRNLELGVLLGALLGIGLAYLVENIKRTVVSQTDVEELTGASVLAIIPLFRSSSHNSRRPAEKSGGAASNGVTTDPRLLILKHPGSAEAEAIRSLRTSLMLSRPNGGPRVLLITSCIPGEGKSTVTANLAMSFAQHNKKVIIVEADMRRPSMLHVLDVPNNAGLSSVLAGVSTFEDTVIRSVQVKGLDVLPAGPPPPLPSELLGSRAFDELLDMLRTNYDMVIIDSPPALMLTDAVVIAPKSDGVIWVVRAGVVTRSLLVRAMQVIQRTRMPVIGFLLNGITRSLDPYGYSYEYGYGYNAYESYYRSEESSYVQKK